MRLRKNDLVMLDEEDQSAVYFVQKISGTSVTLAHFEANVDARNSPATTLSASRQVGRLAQSAGARGHISPTGLVSEA